MAAAGATRQKLTTGSMAACCLLRNCCSRKSVSAAGFAASNDTSGCCSCGCCPCGHPCWCLGTAGGGQRSARPLPLLLAAPPPGGAPGSLPASRPTSVLTLPAVCCGSAPASACATAMRARSASATRDSDCTAGTGPCSCWFTDRGDCLPRRVALLPPLLSPSAASAACCSFCSR